MIWPFRRLRLLAFVPIWFWPGVAAAHPHVFIDNHVALRFERARLTGFEVEWGFDEVASDALVANLKLPAAQPWNAATLATIRREAFDNLESYDYFIHVRAAGHPDKVTRIRDFRARLVDRRMVFHFTADLARPIDPLVEPVRAGFFDHTYYVEVAFARVEAIDATAVPDNCRVQLTTDAETPIYDGSVYPQALLISCEKP